MPFSPWQTIMALRGLSPCERSRLLYGNRQCLCETSAKHVWISFGLCCVRPLTKCHGSERPLALERSHLLYGNHRRLCEMFADLQRVSFGLCCVPTCLGILLLADTMQSLVLCTGDLANTAPALEKIPGHFERPGAPRCLGQDRFPF